MQPSMSLCQQLEQPPRTPGSGMTDRGDEKVSIKTRKAYEKELDPPREKHIIKRDKANWNFLN